MKKTVNAAVVGCGYWGPNLIRNLSALADCRLKYMCDVDEKRLAHLGRLYPNTQPITSYDAMLENKELDAVLIATSVRFHYEMAKKSLLAGKHTFIEKPMASSGDECEDLIELAHSKKLTLMVGHTFLYSSPVRKIKEIISSGEIGEIQYISARRLNLGLFQKDINVAWDLAPHDISIILYIMDEFPLHVNCQGNAHITPGIEDVTSMCMTFSNNRFAVVQNSWLDPRKVREMTIVGTKKMIVYDDVVPLEKIRIYDSRVETPPHYDTFAEFHYSYHYGDLHVPYVKQEEPLRVECQHFLDCIRTGSKPLSNGRQGWELVRILEASSASLKQQGAAIEFRQREPGSKKHSKGGPALREVELSAA